MSDTRRTDPSIVQKHFHLLTGLLKSEFSPGYFNAPDVLEAEAQGHLNVIFGALGHVQSTLPGPDLSRRAEELVTRVAASLIPEEVVNRCHNLHLTLLMFLDRIGYPTVQARGLVNAEDSLHRRHRGFVLNPVTRVWHPAYRPGHSWLITPEYSVLDLSIRYQADTGDQYEDLKAKLPEVVRVQSTESTEPLMKWWRLPGQSKTNLSPVEYAKVTNLLRVTGWSQFTAGTLAVRYVPTELYLPKESSLDEIRELQIGGLDPATYFERHLQDLVDGS